MRGAGRGGSTGRGGRGGTTGRGGSIGRGGRGGNNYKTSGTDFSIPVKFHYDDKEASFETKGFVRDKLVYALAGLGVKYDPNMVLYTGQPNKMQPLEHDTRFSSELNDIRIVIDPEAPESVRNWIQNPINISVHYNGQVYKLTVPQETKGWGIICALSVKFHGNVDKLDSWKLFNESGKCITEKGLDGISCSSEPVFYMINTIKVAVDGQKKATQLLESHCLHDLPFIQGRDDPFNCDITVMQPFNTTKGSMSVRIDEFQ